jgi:GH24 family phage-related lysozyme (muramidase)
MRKYKYTKGNEGHFYGAPEEATMLVIDNNKRKYFVEISPTPGARYWGAYGGSGIWGEGVYRSQFLCIAKRYIVDIEEQAPNECTDPTEALITERGSRYGKFKDGVSSLITSPTTQGQFDAMVSLAYNIGIGNFGKSTLLKKHNARCYTCAADQFRVWNRANGKVMNGLTKRRAAEREVYMS